MGFNNFINLKVSGSDDASIILWSTSSGLSLYNYTGHTMSVSAVSVFATTIYVASKKNIYLYLICLDKHNRFVYLKGGSWDNTIKIWNGN
jgi:WD40 repeat protein